MTEVSGNVPETTQRRQSASLEWSPAIFSFEKLCSHVWELRPGRCWPRGEEAPLWLLSSSGHGPTPGAVPPPTSAVAAPSSLCLRLCDPTLGVYSSWTVPADRRMIQQNVPQPRRGGNLGLCDRTDGAGGSNSGPVFTECAGPVLTMLVLPSRCWLFVPSFSFVSSVSLDQPFK